MFIHLFYYHFDLYRHVHRDGHRHVHGHAHGHVQRHVHRHLQDTRAITCMGVRGREPSKRCGLPKPNHDCGLCIQTRFFRHVPRPVFRPVFRRTFHANGRCTLLLVGHLCIGMRSDMWLGMCIWQGRKQAVRLSAVNRVSSLNSAATDLG